MLNTDSQRDPSVVGRDPGNGRFAHGNPGGPGNPFVGKISALKSAILDVVGPDEMKRVFRHALGIAVGDEPDASYSERTAAARFVTEYAIGKPRAAETEVEMPGGFTVIIKREGE